MTKKILFVVVVLAGRGGSAVRGAGHDQRAVHETGRATARKTSTAGTRDFQKANPNINVVLTFVPYEQLEEKIITSAQAGSYDVVLSDGPFTAKFAKAGIIKEVPALSAADQKDIFAGALLSTIYMGKS